MRSRWGTLDTQDEVAKVAIEVIARHNESASVPKLYFAGFTNEDWVQVPDNPNVSKPGNFPAGITLFSTSCALMSLVKFAGMRRRAPTTRFVGKCQT